MKDFKTLSVWDLSHKLTLCVYKISSCLPREELFGLTSQLRRSCSSIPANIAEGCGKSTDPEFARFLQIAFGSACEVEYHLILARDLAYISLDDFERVTKDVIVVKKMLSALIGKLRADR